jgi:DNA-binding NarL/FixJ family response regulator
MAVVDSGVRRGVRRARTRSEVATAIPVAYAAGDEMTSRRVGAALVREGFDVAVAARTTGDLAASCQGLLVDAAVLCCDRILLDDPGRLEHLREELPDTGIVIVCSADGGRPVRRALAAGVDGYVCEAELERALGPTVRAVVAGQVCLPHDIRDHFRKPAFSYREKQVLQLVARGFTNSEIARALFLAESTVKSHLSSSFRKLGVASRKEAAQVVLDPESGLHLDAPTASGAPALPELVTS